MSALLVPKQIAMPPIKLILGAGATFQDGWHSLKQEDLDLLNREQWSKLVAPESVKAMLAEHVWEHLTMREGCEAARNCYDYLKPGGYLRVAVPDGLHPNERYRDWVKPGGTWQPDEHKVLFTYETLASLFMLAGFKVRLLEWFDKQGRLNFARWRFRDGNIQRSYKHWYANTFLSVVVGAPYTSLIIDAIKES
jgi:predicted SAM-dependent methyltransferase